MNEHKDKTLMRIIDVNKFNEDMELIEKYSDLIKTNIRKIILEKIFCIEDLCECNRIANSIWGYSNIIRKNDIIYARKYLRGIANINGSLINLNDNMSQELKEILSKDKFWNEEIDKTK